MQNYNNPPNTILDFVFVGFGVKERHQCHHKGLEEMNGNSTKVEAVVV